MVNVQIVKMYDDVVIPQYAKPGDAGMDIRAYFSKEFLDNIDPVFRPSPYETETGIYIHSGERKIIPTGIKVAIPLGYEIQVRPRSGLALKKGLTVLNAPGTIDAGYRGEVGVILYNTTKNSVGIEHGERIAQLVLNQVPQIEWEEVDVLSETSRGEGGFGSTGVA